MESVCGGNSTAGSNPALSANCLCSEPGMELGPCASPSSEPCQARKGAALRGNTTSAAGCLGSMTGSSFPRASPRPSARQNSDSTDQCPEPLEDGLGSFLGTVRLIRFPPRGLQKAPHLAEPGTIPKRSLPDLSRHHVLSDPARKDR